MKFLNEDFVLLLWCDSHAVEAQIAHSRSLKNWKATAADSETMQSASYPSELNLDSIGTCPDCSCVHFTTSLSKCCLVCEICGIACIFQCQELIHVSCRG